MSIEAKLEQIEELLKNNFLPSPKGPKLQKPSVSLSPALEPQKPVQAIKPGANASKKDPMKVAEQIANPDLKDDAKKKAQKLKEGITVNKLGQWSLTNKPG
jgi:hypothetical protein